MPTEFLSFLLLLALWLLQAADAPSDFTTEIPLPRDSNALMETLFSLNFLLIVISASEN